METKTEVSRGDGVRKRVLIITGIIVVVIGIVIGIHFIYINSGLTRSDLISTSVENTTFLRPKEWASRGNGVTAYSDLKAGETGVPNAVLGLQVSTSELPADYITSDSSVATVRKTTLGLITTTSVNQIFSSGRSLTCVGKPTLQKDSDTATSSTTIGLYNVTSVCATSGESYVLRMHAVVGRDRYVRTLIFIVNQSEWNRYKPIFQTMLASLQQSKSPTSNTATPPTSDD